MSRAFRLGVFVVLALAAFSAGIFLIGKNQMMFASKYRLYAQFKTVAGLANGGQVRVAGIQKGVVKRIELPRHPGDEVRVMLELDSDTRQVLRKDSTASIQSEGLMGDEYMEISAGSDNAPSLRDGDTIEGRPPIEMADLVQKASGLLDTANGAVANVAKTAGTMSSITSKIDNGTGTIGALVNNKQVFQNMTNATSAMQEDMEAVKHNFLLSHFFNKRGYEDASDLTKHQIAQLPPDQPVQQFSWDQTKIFDKPETAKLKDPKQLKNAGDYLQSNSFGLAVIVGYADMKGDAQTEKTLTEARAMVVRDYLVKNFKMDDTRVKTIGLGKSSETESPGVSVLIYPAKDAPAAEARK